MVDPKRAQAIDADRKFRKYGKSAAWYDAQLAAQGGHCAICPATEPGGGRKNFCIDHDHSTGKVRGLLCHHCNLYRVGMNDVSSALRVAAYLKNSEKK